MVELPRMHKAVFSLFLYFAFFLSACAYSWNGTTYPDSQQAPQLSLRDTKGAAAPMWDKPTLVFFGYTSCPDVCPATLADMRWVFEQLADEAHRARFIFITIDPDRDTPERLGSHLDRFNTEFVGLFGTPDELEEVKQAFGVFAEIDSHSDQEHHLITHTARTYLVDAHGMFQASYRFGTPREAILEDLRHSIG